MGLQLLVIYICIGNGTTGEGWAKSAGRRLGKYIDKNVGRERVRERQTALVFAAFTSNAIQASCPHKNTSGRQME